MEKGVGYLIISIYVRHYYYATKRKKNVFKVFHGKSNGENPPIKLKLPYHLVWDER